MKHSIKALENIQKEYKLDIRFMFKYRKRNYTKKKIIESIEKVRDYERAIKILKK